MFQSKMDTDINLSLDDIIKKHKISRASNPRKRGSRNNTGGGGKNRINGKAGDGKISKRPRFQKNIRPRTVPARSPYKRVSIKSDQAYK